MHHSFLNDSCLDIDGVLCRDPSPEENDDGPRYEKFLTETNPLVIPTDAKNPDGGFGWWRPGGRSSPAPGAV